MTDQTLTKVAQRLNRRFRQERGGDLPPVLMLTDERRLPDPVAALGNLPRGSAVILRHYSLPAPDRRALGEALRTETAARNMRLLVAADATMARDLDADGLHVPEGMIGRLHRWRQAGRFDLVTTAVHSLPAMQRAVRAGADALLLSPVFPTGSHPGASSLGPVRAALWLGRVTAPVYALGGVSDQTAQRLLPFGFAGLAAVGAFRTD